MQQEKNILVNRGIPRQPSSSSGFGFNVWRSSGSDHSDRAYDAIDHAFDWLQDSNESVEEAFKENIKNITHITDTELAKTRAAVRAATPAETNAVDIELRTLNLHISKTKANHQQQIITANLYYGHDPLTHKTGDPTYKGFELVGRGGGQRRYHNAITKWNVSYAAAHHAKFLAEQIKLLNARLTIQNKAIAEAKATAAAAAQAKAQAEAKRIAAEKARAAAEAEAKRIAAERARLAAEAQRQVAAEKAAAQAKAQAEAEAKRIAAQAARIAAEAEAHRIAQGQALRQALAGHAFPISGTAAVSSPVFAIAGSSLAISPEVTSAVRAALRTAITMAVESIGAVAAPALTGFAALLYSSELGNGDLYALSVPLSELTPDNSDDLHAVATAQGEINLPVAIGSRTTANTTEFAVTDTRSAPTLSKVPVRLATLDPLGNFYRTVSPDAASSTVIWTPLVKPDGMSTSLPAKTPDIPLYSGATPVVVTGRIDTHPEFDLYHFGGFVTVFPIESGIAPIYTVFNSPYEGATTKGEHSGRDFNPEQAGGPILELDWRTATVTQEGIDAVKLHIARLDQSNANDVMIERLERILNGEISITDIDKRFYTHETRELERFRAQGLADNFIPSNDSAEWNNAHTATLEDYKLGNSESLLYSLEALEAGRRQIEEEYKRLLKGEF